MAAASAQRKRPCRWTAAAVWRSSAGPSPSASSWGDDPESAPSTAAGERVAKGCELCCDGSTEKGAPDPREPMPPPLDITDDMGMCAIERRPSKRGTRALTVDYGGGLVRRPKEVPEGQVADAS